MASDAIAEDIPVDRSFTIGGLFWSLLPENTDKTAALATIRFEDVKADYTQLWQTIVISPQRLATIDHFLDRILASKPRYEAVAATSEVPFHVIAILHLLEAGLSFRGHLHNGDPLTARTVHVPAGRPVTGNPPFTWEESAADALAFDGLTRNSDWSVERTAFEFERFNGFGYRLFHPEVKSPYLWSFSNHYTRGKFIGDGQFSADAVSDQCGAMVMLRRMQDRGAISLAVA